jgi:hypothetical protein
MKIAAAPPGAAAFFFTDALTDFSNLALADIRQLPG